MDYKGWRETALLLLQLHDWLMDYAGQHSPHLPLEKPALNLGFAAFGPTRVNTFSCWHDKGGQGGG